MPCTVHTYAHRVGTLWKMLRILHRSYEWISMWKKTAGYYILRQTEELRKVVLFYFYKWSVLHLNFSRDYVSVVKILISARYCIFRTLFAWFKIITKRYISGYRFRYTHIWRICTLKGQCHDITDWKSFIALIVASSLFHFFKHQNTLDFVCLTGVNDTYESMNCAWVHELQQFFKYWADKIEDKYWFTD
jgi:hypothetical protein